MQATFSTDLQQDDYKIAQPNGEQSHIMQMPNASQFSFSLDRQREYTCINARQSK